MFYLFNMATFFVILKNKVESSTEKGSGPLPRNDKCLCRVSQYCVYGQLMLRKCVPSAGLEEQNGHLTQVEVNEMLGLMSHVAAKVSPNNAVPGRVILLVKLLCGEKDIFKLLMTKQNKRCNSLIKHIV